MLHSRAIYSLLGREDSKSNTNTADCHIKPGWRVRNEKFLNTLLKYTIILFVNVLLTVL